MSFDSHKAQVADVQRAFQRDSAFVDELQDEFAALLKLLGNSTYNAFRKYIPAISTSWYYFTTSVSNRQTLGEEYAGILRVVSGSKIPGRLLQFIWLLLFVCGDDAYDKVIINFKNRITQSTALTVDAKDALLCIINFLSRNKNTFIALHRSIFYITGTYYCVSNRITGIKFLLLRNWMQDATYTQSFRLLGKASLLYLLYSLIKDFFSKNSEETAVYKDSTISSKLCVLCGDTRQNASATPCGHLFCWDCIHNCLLYQSNCPICRDFIKPNKIILLQNYA